VVVTRKPLPIVVGLAVCCAMFAWMPESRAQDDDDLLGELSPSEDGLAPTEEEGAPPPAEDEPLEELDAPAKPAAKKAAPEEQVSPAAQDRIKAVPRKAVLKVGRIELAAFASFSLNDPYWQHFAASGSVVWYPHDAFGIGIGVDYLYAHARQSNLDVVRQSLTSVPAVFEKPRMFAHLDLYWIPIYGKISLANKWIVHFELYGTAGAGLATAFGERQPPAVNVGIGQRFFLSRWLALRFEVRDHLFVDTLTVGDRDRSDVQSYVMFMAGASFFIPPSFEYSYR
jgi:outer membrane beta-barrel protein